MNARELTLNMAVNLGRLSRWVGEGKLARVSQFIAETDEYLKLLEKSKKSERFEVTLKLFVKSFSKLRESKRYDDEWAEEALTWSNILSHSAKLA